jgi:hypothetical protein
VSSERPRSRRRVNQPETHVSDAGPNPERAVLVATSGRAEAARQRRIRLRGMLRDPESLRMTFLVHEILSSPVSMRQPNVDRPT